MRFDRRAREWVEEVTGSSVARVRPLRGGGSSVHDLALADGRRLVIRRMVDEPGLTDGRERTRSEAVALTRVAGSALAPGLVAADPAGERSGAPAVLITRLPGRPWLTPGPRVAAWVDGLAAALRLVHDLDDPAADLVRTEPWLDAAVDPPPWTAVPEAWAWAFTVARAGLPEGSADRLVHRDLHPGNVLFDRRRLSGVVDWEATCRAPGELDLARCRVQVAVLLGPEAADALLDRCGDVAPAYGPAWDAVVACELSPWSEMLFADRRTGAEVTLDGVRAALDAVVTRAYGP